jgi:glutamine amidotransferase
MIAIVDYGVGNVSAFANVYKQLNIPFSIASEPADIKVANGIVLPGVGAFDYAMEKFDSSGLRSCVERSVIEKTVPVLGICVGMQMLGVSSEEGKRAGLGWIDGIVRRFDTAAFEKGTPLPHMGWNNADFSVDNSLFNGLDNQSRFYFLHSFYFQCRDEDDVISTTEYSMRFVSAVGRNNIFGVQFHPEKSHRYGVQLLRNFSQIAMGQPSTLSRT